MALPGAEDMEGTYSNGSKSFLDRGNPERPILIPDNFDGKGDFDNWVSYFECVATINGWTNEEKLLWIRVSLRGAAHVAYQCFDHETQNSYVTVKTALRERFEPQCKSELYKIEFEKRGKNEEDTWPDFADELMVLARRAFPGLQNESKEIIALNKFLANLQDPRVCLAVRQRRPRTLREAVSATLEMESYLLTLPVTSDDNDDCSDGFSNVKRVGSTTGDLEVLEEIRRLAKRVEQLESDSTRVHREATPPQQAWRAKEVTCYCCGNVGHYARGCALKTQCSIPAAPNETRPNPLNCISINNVSSYVLSCNVHGVPMSFLIDTGAGVSLLDKEAWDRIKSKAGDLNLVSNHRLVGVDGIPLKVLGSVIAPLSVSGFNFSHKFIVAEGLTTDAIMGLDFLESNKCVLDLAKGKIIIADQSVALVPNSPSLHTGCCSSVMLSQNCVVPPRSEMEIVAHLDSKEDGTWLVEGISSPSAQIMIARALTKAQDQSVVLRIVNIDVSPVTLYRNSKIATAELITDSAICNTCEQGEVSASGSYLAKDIPLTLPDDVTAAQKEQFLALLSHYSDIIAARPDELGRTTVMQHCIDTGNAAPIRQQARRVPLPRRETVHTLLNDMLEKGIISPSKSPWASPIVLVKKKDGSIRFCIDYRKINGVTRKDAYPLPRVDDTLDTLTGSTWFTTIDLRSGYWQVEVAPKDREKTAFCTQEGLFQFNVMPFGLCNAPATFQRLMDCVLAGLQWTSCLVYIDDVIIMGKSFESHLHNLQQVFDRLRQAGLKLHPYKCQFLQHEVRFLGHIVSANGVSPDPDKTVKVKDWPTPTSRQETQQFLGLANYYRRFIKDFATIAKPLHKLTEKKQSFKWTYECQQAFAQLKHLLTTAPILALPDWSRPFIVDTDASDSGIGAVLSQTNEKGEEHVISYASRLLTKTERNYCVTRKELLAVVTFLHHFRQYLIGTNFVVRTDHGALTWLQNFKSPEGQLARWLEKLQDFEFSIVHRPGKRHCNADALSRLPCRQCGRVVENVIATITSSDICGGYTQAEIRDLQLDDCCVGELLKAMESHQKPSPDHAKSKSVKYRRLYQQWDQLMIRNGVLWRQYEHPNEQQSWLQLVAPTTLQSEIIKEAHEGTTGGHLGQDKTLHRVKDSIGQGTLMTFGIGVDLAIVASPGRHLLLLSAVLWVQFLLGTPCR